MCGLRKNFPIVKAVKFYLHKDFCFISKLCAAVTNFFTRTLPDKASDARKYFTAGFNKLKQAEQKHNKPLAHIRGLSCKRFD